jgi:hypothetical protein
MLSSLIFLHIFSIYFKKLEKKYKKYQNSKKKKIWHYWLISSHFAIFNHFFIKKNQKLKKGRQGKKQSNKNIFFSD